MGVSYLNCPYIRLETAYKKIIRKYCGLRVKMQTKSYPQFESIYCRYLSSITLSPKLPFGKKQTANTVSKASI